MNAVKSIIGLFRKKASRTEEIKGKMLEIAESMDTAKKIEMLEKRIIERDIELEKRIEKATESVKMGSRSYEQILNMGEQNYLLEKNGGFKAC